MSVPIFEEIILCIKYVESVFATQYNNYSLIYQFELQLVLLFQE